MAYQTMTNDPSETVKPTQAANGNTGPGPGTGFQEEREMWHRQMLSTVSHDLKTPLASVIGSLEIYQRMGDKLSEDKKATLIQTALTEAYRLDSFLTNILDMAKLEGNLVPVKPEPSDIRALLESAVASQSMRLEKASVNIQGAANVSGMIDPALFGRMIGLVLDNAVKHGGPQSKIDIRYRKSDTRLTIEIADNGPGIPAGKEEEIFSKYTRLAKGDHQNTGTGLGLAIARQIARRLGGNISAINQLNGGACFIYEGNI